MVDHVLLYITVCHGVNWCIPSAPSNLFTNARPVFTTLPSRKGRDRGGFWGLYHTGGRLLEWRPMISPIKGRATPLAAYGLAGVLVGMAEQRSQVLGGGGWYSYSPSAGYPWFSLLLSTSSAQEGLMLELILGFNGHLLQRAPKFPRSFMGGGGVCRCRARVAPVAICG